MMYGFFGGSVPTVLTLATNFVNAHFSGIDLPLPAITFWIGLFLLGAIGSVVSSAFGQKSAREAFVAGIVAPSLIINVVSSASLQRNISNSSPTVVQQRMSFLNLITPANAQPSNQSSNTPNVQTQLEPPALVIGSPTDPKRLIDFSITTTQNSQGVEPLNVRFYINNPTNGAEPSATVRVPINFHGTILVPTNFNYAKIENRDPISIPPNNVELVLGGRLRTSRTNDFFWSLGYNRNLKFVVESAEARPIDARATSPTRFAPINSIN